MEFSYKSIGSRFYPLVPIKLTNKGKSYSTDGLLDSGATLSFFNHEAASQLGITIQHGRPIVATTSSGNTKAYVHQVEVTVGETTFLAPLAFAKDKEPYTNLLGRSNIFTNFTVVFKEQEHLVKLL